MRMNREDFFKLFKNQRYVEQLKQIPQQFAVKHDEEKKLSELTIYGVIGNSWWDESVSANDIDRALKEAGDNDIIVYLNSPGGDAFDGISIFNRLKRHHGKVTVYVDGWAASAASIIAMAGDEVIMSLGSMLMIHEAWNIIIGSKTDMRKEADVLEELEEGIIDIYMTKANISREEIRSMVDAETWFSAKKAVELGFADKLEGDQTENDDDNDEDVVLNSAIRTLEEKQEILNELKTVLNKEPSPKTNGKGSFNMLKKWR